MKIFRPRKYTKNSRLLLFLFIPVLFLSGLAFSQDYPVLHYTSNDGLPSNTVYFVYRDSRGFLWFATDKGIARYNGSKFETFTSFDGLPDNEIFCFKEDHEQRLWVGCYNGELCYFKNDTFYTAKNKSFLRLPYKFSHVGSISLEYDSSVIFNFSDPNKFLVIKKEQCQYIDIEKESKKYSIPSASILRKKAGPNLYKVFNYGTIVLADASGTFKKIKHTDLDILHVTTCQDQDFLFNSEYFFNVDEMPIKRFPKNFIKENLLHQIYVDGGFTFYVTNTGLYINDSIKLLNGKKTTGISRDIYGNYWVTTLDEGIYCLDASLVNIKIHKNVYSGEALYAHADTSAIFFTTDQSELFRLSKDRLQCIVSKSYLERMRLKELATSAFLIDNKDRYHCVTGLGLVQAENLHAAKPDIRNSKPAFLQGGTKSIYFNKDYIYFQRYFSINISRIQTINNPLHHYTIWESERIFATGQDLQQQVWYSTISHVYKINGTHTSIQSQFKNLAFKRFRFSGNYLIGITNDNQLAICNNPSGQVTISYVPNNNCIWAYIYPLDSNQVIVSTNNNNRIISLFPSADTPRYAVFTVENSFIPLQPQTIASDGERCHFFKDGSITSIDIKNLFIKPHPPKLFYTNIKTATNVYPVKQDVTIPYAASKFLKISFAVLSFGNRELFYQYAVFKTNPSGWTDVKADELNLINPGFGDYTVMVRAKTISSEYSEPIVFHLHILRPFWATWWFIGLMCLGLAGLLLGIGAFIKRSVLKTAEKKNLQMELELKAIYAQINPHFIFNTLNSALSLVRTKKLDEAYNHISQFSRLLRSYIKSSRNKLISIADEITNLTDYLELQKTRFGGKFEFAIHVQDGIQSQNVKIPSLLLQPFVENALNHGLLPKKETGHLYIKFAKGDNENELICSIDDDGIGRKKTTSEVKNNGKESSYGDLLIKDLVSIFNKYEQMNIKIEYEDKESPLSGTIVVIYIKNPNL